MYIVDLKEKIIHDMSFVRYECQIRKIEPEDKKKVFSLQTVKRMVDTEHKPPYNGCQYCMSEYHAMDFTKIFR